MDPGDLNSSSPLIHVSCRRALAHAIDRQRVADGGPWCRHRHPGQRAVPTRIDRSIWRTRAIPTIDLDAAATEWETCKTDARHRHRSRFCLQHHQRRLQRRDQRADRLHVDRRLRRRESTSPSPRSSRASTSAWLWPASFQAQGWRNHAVASTRRSSGTGGTRPRPAPSIQAVPELALNFGRFQDPEMDAALHHHPPEPGSGRPPGGGRGCEPALR